MKIILPNRYQVAGLSSGGGMGDIHQCLDTHLNRLVILKMLKDEMEGRRLLDEQKALIKLRSKHVVQLYDVIQVTVDAVPKTALVLEYLKGEDLTIGGFKTGPQYLNVLWQIACGLSDIHNANIIHRDIKPNNIRIDGGNVVKILDFGLSRTVGAEARTRSIIGTPVFMAPELWGSATISFNNKIDVYAFAVTALTLGSEKIPAELAEFPPRPVPPGAINGYFDRVAADVVSTLEKCLDHDPSKRPSMKSVEAILRRHLLYDRHRGLLVLGGEIHEINAKNRTVNVRSGPDSLSISYDGLMFTVSGVVGNVLVNNASVNVGQELPGCCVIGFGPRNSYRSFCTFDVSNPEVMP